MTALNDHFGFNLMKRFSFLQDVTFLSVYLHYKNNYFLKTIYYKKYQCSMINSKIINNYK